MSSFNTVLIHAALMAGTIFKIFKYNINRFDVVILFIGTGVILREIYKHKSKKGDQ